MVSLWTTILQLSPLDRECSTPAPMCMALEH